MPCAKCGTKQIINNEELICPKCENISLLPKEVALQVVQKQIDWFEIKFKILLGTFDKPRLLTWLCGKREEQATAFFQTPVLSLCDFLSVNVLIQRVMGDYEHFGIEEANGTNTSELISLFSTYLTIIEKKQNIEDDFGNYITKEKFDSIKIDPEILMSNFEFVINEDYIPILESFEANLILLKSKATKSLEDHKEAYKKILESESKPTTLTPEETIHLLFPSLLSFLGALTKNRLYADTFNLNYLKKKGISPKSILHLIQFIPQSSGLMTKITPEQLKKIIRAEFKGIREMIVYNELVFSFKNKSIFPFFVEIEGNLLISHSFIRLMGLFYYPLYYETLFRIEIENHAKEFEQKIVPEEFIRLGFQVIPNIKDKKNATLEIDLIAWKGNRLYVVEVKIWDLKQFFEHRKTQNERERDLKGVVDGKKYSTIKGVERIKDKASLIKKIDFIKENLSKYCKDSKSINSIQGIVITKSYPTIKEYKTIRFLGFGHIDTL